MNSVWFIKNKAVQIFLIASLFLILPAVLFGQIEICDNGIDDDNDSLIDLNDEDCECDVVEAISLIPNPSFEDMNCCPQERSELNCASEWIQASEPTTDYIHTCDWLGWDEFPPPMPFPDGDGIMGFRDGRVRSSNGNPEPYWKEYAGACLISPLLADSTYRFQFDVGFVSPQLSPPIDISFFGTSNCDHLPFGIGNEAFGCPSNSLDWVKLEEVSVSGGSGNTWVNTFIEITPDENIRAIAIGPDCAPVPSTVSIYYFFDNLQLAELGAFDLKIKENLHPCNQDFTLSVPFNAAFEYQWYKEGVALAGETFSELTQNYGEGFYQVRILDGTSCRVSASFEYVIPVLQSPLYQTICEGDIYEFGELELTEAGSYVDTFTNQDNCDSIVFLELEIIGQEYDTLKASVFEGETFEIEAYAFQEEGDYPLVLTSQLGCDSLVLLQLSTFKIFIPNVFSPNADGNNDMFLPYAKSGEISSVEMQIFDRWGGLLYKGPVWDGYNSQQGVYVYLMQIQFTNGTSKMFSGDITLLK